MQNRSEAALRCFGLLDHLHASQVGAYVASMLASLALLALGIRHHLTLAGSAKAISPF